MPETIHPVNPKFANNALVTEACYREWYKQSIANPEVFWATQAREFLTWFKPWETVLTGTLAELNVRWFEGGQLNAAYNCLDRHLLTQPDYPAIIWESDDPEKSHTLSYKELHVAVCRLANVLKQYGIKKGDRVCIYLPMIPEAAIAMLACARIGAPHSVVFAGFSADSLKTRILDADCRLVITANESVRGNKIYPLKQNVDLALKDCPNVKTVIVVKRTENLVKWDSKRDVWYTNAVAVVSSDCMAEVMDANDPLFVLYTSGSTGKPKGILHGSAGYLLYTAMTFKYIFDYREHEIFWCTADIGWITGHTYTVYGPLLNGGTTLMFEGVPHFPDFSRFWQVIDKHHVNIFYTAPTAIRALRAEGDNWVESTSRKSLRLLGSVGEPINPEAWEWYYQIVGEKRCPIVDTWWQTETGGIMISPLPGATPLKPGSAAWPFFGCVPQIVDEENHPVPDGKMGKLLITQPWPGMLQTIYNNPERFVNAYFNEYPGCYLTGDQAYKDADGYYWIQGRSDDVIKVSGHRIGTQEVESALICHQAVSEAAVVAIPNDIKGHSIYAFITLKMLHEPSSQLQQEIKLTVREQIGAIAVPETIHWAKSLPKTRSGKIMRRLLRKIAMNEVNDLGDLSTLADPDVVAVLIRERG